MRPIARFLFAQIFLIALTVGAQAAGNEAMRTSWGDPDLQGIWTNASLTQLERATNVNKLVLTPAEGATYERIAKERMARANAPSDPGRPLTRTREPATMPSGSIRAQRSASSTVRFAPRGSSIRPTDAFLIRMKAAAN